MHRKNTYQTIDFTLLSSFPARASLATKISYIQHNIIKVLLKYNREANHVILLGRQVILVCRWPPYKMKWGNVCTLRVSSCCSLAITVHTSSGTPVMLTTEESDDGSEATSIHLVRLYVIFTVLQNRERVQMVDLCGSPWQAQSGITVSAQSGDNAPALGPCAVLLCSSNSSSALSWEEYSGPALTPHSGLFFWWEGHYISYSLNLIVFSHTYTCTTQHTHSERNSQFILSMVPHLFLQGALAPHSKSLQTAFFNTCPQQIIIA